MSTVPPSATNGPFTVEVFRSEDGRVFANVSQGGIQLAHLKAGETFTSTETSRSETPPKWDGIERRDPIRNLRSDEE